MIANSLMYAESSYLNRTWVNGAYDKDGEIIEDVEETTSIVEIDEDHKMTYGLYILAVAHRIAILCKIMPLSFDSLLFENIWIKNRDGLNFINNRVAECLPAWI